MKVDRRSFLGLGLGAVAGVAVSPVGLKLTDDSSIWTQNWPWTPVPADGKVNYENSVCSLCPGSCGIKIKKIENRPVKIEGQSDYPVNSGGACLHGIAGLQYLFDPSRVKTPLKKTGDKFEKISWDDAMKAVTEKLAEIRQKGTPEKLACVTDKDQGSVSALFKRFLKAYGSSNYYTMPSLESHLELTASTMHGQGRTMGFDLENADFVLSFGAGIIEGWGSPVACFKANASKKERHAKLYQIEPRLSNTAANADRWIPINPGTEGDLALGICNVILNENLFDSVSVAGFSGGVNRFNAVLNDGYTPEKISKITGVSVSDIEDIARSFAKAKNPLAVFARGKGDKAQSLKEMTAVHTLNCLVGNINKKGGVFVRNQKKYLGFQAESLDGTAVQGLAAKKVGTDIFSMFENTKNIEALFIYNANPCYALHNPEKIKKAVNQVPFKVCFSSFLDETAQQADIILPCHTFLEKYEDVPSGAGFADEVVGLTRPIVKPVFDTKNPGDTVILLAKAMGGSIGQSFPWNSYEDCLKKAASGIWNSLYKKGYAVLSKGAPLSSYYVDISFLADNPEGIKIQGSSDMVLIPIDNMRLANSNMASSPFAVKTVGDDVISRKDIVVEINPASAKGLRENGYAIVTTPLGKARVKVFFNDGLMPGVIGMAAGLGHSSENKYVSGKGVNINDLIDAVIEPGSGLDAAFGIKAQISAA